MNTAQFAIKAAHSFGDRPALSHGTEVVLDYRGFADRIARLAAGLRGELRLRPGDRVAIGMKNVPELMVVMFAAWHAGLCAVPMNAKLHRREFEYILTNSGTRACFITPDMEKAIAGLEDDIPTLDRVIDVDSGDYAALVAAEPMPCAEVEPTEPAWLFYTSGTTGRPKGATISHRAMVMMTMSYFADVDPLSERDCIIHAAPMTHGSGIYGVPHVAKAANQVVPRTGGFDVGEMLELIARWPNCSFFFAPTMVVRMLNSPALEGADLTNLKAIVYGGGPMYVEDTLRALEVFGPRLVQVYGQGESPMTITCLSKAMHADSDHPRYRQRLGSAGIPRTDVEVRIVDEDDNTLPAGEIGEICVRGDVLMNGYWENAEATAKALKGGWLHTGDVGSMDEDGFVTLMDRSKDMIISGGTNIYPREIEEVLLMHPAVLECSVVGKPHPEWGEEVFAFIVKRDGQSVDPDELDALCLDNIARFKRPKHYRFVESLPKNNYGKVLKTELREWLKQEAEESAA